jgi:Universal stress protein family
MLDGNDELLGRIVLALDGLIGELDVSGTAPRSCNRYFPPDGSQLVYERIVAGVDGSAGGERATRHVAGLATALGAALRVVHVVDMSRPLLTPELGLNIEGLAACP